MERTVAVHDWETGEITVRPFTDEENAWQDHYEQNILPGELWETLRMERGHRLAETDWWVLADRTPTAEQLAYRQALRDLPATTTDPANPVWPTKPE